MGAFLSAREHLEKAISLYEPERPRSRTLNGLGVDAGVFCLSVASATLWQIGYPDQALKRDNEALALAQRLSHPYSLAFAQFFPGFLSQCRREVREAHQYAENIIGISAEHGFAQLLAFGTSLRGWAMAAGGNREGLAQLQQGLAGSRATGTELYMPYLLCLLAEGYSEAGRLDDGLSALAEALDAADQRDERQAEAEIHRLKGELLLRQDESNAGEARKCFERAIEVARQQSARSWELRATMSLARLLMTQGKRDEARAMLADIYNWFTEGFDTADLKDAKALLEELTA
jgi:predicted ATPase